MKMYLSGLSGKKELAMVANSGAGSILVDPTEMEHMIAAGYDRWLPIDEPKFYNKEIMLDSGAYRAWKTHVPYDTDAYILYVLRWLKRLVRLSFVVAPDVIGDAEATWANYCNMRNHYPVCMPVWHWGSDKAYLKEYLDMAPTVGIGALVPLMRAKDAAMLDELVELCTKNPSRFHIFGINWLKAIEKLNHLVWSGDTSKWLDGARHATIILIHTKNGHLCEVPQRALSYARGWSREERCIRSAQALIEYCNEH